MVYQKGNKVDKVLRDRNRRSGVKTIHDVGCGTGYFLNEMKGRGWSVSGVEKSEDAGRFAKDNFDIDILSDISKVDDRAKFNVITLWHVLEHIQNLDYTLDKLYKLLDEKGTLILALPNCGSYDAKKYCDMWAAYDVPRHLWHFEPDTLSKLVTQHGFYIEKYSTMPFDAFYVSMLSEKNKGNSMPFLRGVITGLTSLFKIINDPKESSSLIYILRKSNKK